MPPIKRAIRTKGKVGRKRNVAILELGQGLCLVPQLCLTLWDPIYYSLLGSSVHGDSPGKNIGVGCHACLQGILPTQGSKLLLLWLLYCKRVLYLLRDQRKMWKGKSLSVSDSLWSHGLYSPWNSPGQNTGDGSHSLLQGIFPTQRLNLGLPHCKQTLYYLSHQGSP